MSSPGSQMWARSGVLLAAWLMILSGAFQFFQGIAAVAKGSFYAVSGNYAFKIDTTAWGWIHLVLGLIIAVTGFFLLNNSAWARGVGIGLAVIQALSQFFFMPYYPLWSISIIALDVFIIWALATAPSNVV
jgi:hypothetical protein